MLDSGPGRSHARRRPEVAPCDGGGITTKDNVRDSSVYSDWPRSGPSMGHRMNGCLRGDVGVLARRPSSRHFDRGKRERFLCGDGGVLSEQSRKPSKKILAERAATIQIIRTNG